MLHEVNEGKLELSFCAEIFLVIIKKFLFQYEAILEFDRVAEPIKWKVVFSL